MGGFLLALGLFTRSVAFVLAGNMAVAYFMAHSPRGFFPLLNGGELAIVYCFIFLYLWLAGGGECSLSIGTCARLRIRPVAEPGLSIIGQRGRTEQSGPLSARDPDRNDCYGLNTGR